MRVLGILAMCVCLAALVQAQTVPPPYVLRSSDEILAAVDDATASELRFILAATCFADGGVGFSGETPRSTIAFHRLLKSKCTTALEALCYSESGVAALFGFKGLAQLNPDSLRYLLAKFAKRREPIMAMYGCINEETSLAAEVLEYALGTAARVDEHMKRGCARAWLHSVRDHGARQSDATCARRCRSLAPELFRGSEPHIRYATLLAEERESEMCAIVSSEVANRRLRQLCTDYLALQHCRDSWNPARFDEDAVAWLEAGELPGKEWYVIVAARAWQLWAPPRLPFDHTFQRDEDLQSKWRTLKPNQWRVLLAHRNPLVIQAAQFLKRHPIAGGGDFNDPPPDSSARKLWLMASLAHAKTTSELKPVLEYLATNPADYPFVCRGRAYAWHRVTCCEPECAKALGSWLKALLGHADLELRMAGFDMIRSLLNAEMPLHKAIFSTWNVNEDIDRALPLIDLCSDSTRWRYRARLLRLIDELRDAYPQYRPLVKTWHRELCFFLVSNPRALPVQVVSSDDDERAIELLEGFLEGREHFIPDSEWTNESEPDTSDPLVLFSRMKAALAKLGK
ncbi:MAG: hypothetical protein IT461_05245 [Planctomycetes bacterium]|nr:hypothetical protein [Planctomycetota bacterium]